MNAAKTQEHPITQTTSNTLRLRYWLILLLVVPLEIYGIIVTALLLLYPVLQIIPQLGFLWPVMVVVNLMPGILVPAPFLLVMGLFLRRKRTIGFMVVPTLTLLVLYGGLFIPRTAALTEDAVTFTVMTFNTHTEPYTYTEIEALLREADADIVALQELNPLAAEHFETALIDLYPYQSTLTDGSVRGKGILSKYPIEDVQWSHPETPIYQRVMLNIQGESLIFYNVHLFPPAWGLQFNTIGRNESAEFVLSRTTQDDGPIVIVGDMNTTDQTDDYYLFTAHYTDTHREIGMGVSQTFPDYGNGAFPMSILPQIIRIDYIFHTDEVIGVWGHVWHESAGSDHRPYIAELAIQ